MANEIDWSKFQPEAPIQQGSGPTTDWSGFVPEPVPESPGLLRQGADLLLDFAQGGMGVVGAGAAAFGADNVVAKGAGEIAKYAAELQSQQRQAERQGQAERMQAAEATGSMWEEAKVAGQNFLETPGAFTASAVGSAVPTMAAAMLGGLPAAAVTGGGIGAGAVKQSIYERIEQEALKAGQTPEQAAATASAAQAYTGESADQIALGTGLGLAAGGTGLERVFGGGTSAIKNIVGRVAAGTAAEAVPEAVQGGQERLAANLAAQREGFGGETWTGVVGQGVTEGLASTGPGAVGGLMTPYLDPNAGPISRAAIQAQAQRAAVVPGTLQQAAAAAPTEQDAPPESAGNPNRFDPSSAVPAWLGQYEQTNPIATTSTSPAAPNDQQQEQLRLVPMKNEEAAARRAEAVAKRTGTEHVVIPHPSVPERFAVVPVDSPLASPAIPTEQAEGLDVEGLFSTQAPIPLKNARNLAGMMSMAGGVEHAVVPSPTGEGFGIVPVDQLSPAQRGAWAQYQPGARRGAAGRAPGPSAAPTATATPVTPSSTTSNTATPIGTPDAGPELAQVTGATPAAPAVPAVPEGAQGFNTEASRAAPALPQIDSDTLAAAIGNAQTTIRRERWTPEGGSRFEGRVRAELERAGVQKEAAQAVIDLARQQTPTDAFVTSDALVQAARTLGIVPPTSTAAPDTKLRPLDHGELSIPGRTDGIDAELDRWKADQAKAKRAQAKTDAATRREQKAEAKRLFSQFGPAMIERFAPRFGRKEIQNELDSMVKWEPGKFIDLAQRFEREQAATSVPTATPPTAPKPWDLSQDEFVKRVTFQKDGARWSAQWNGQFLEGENEEFDHPTLGKTIVTGGRFFKTKREAALVARGAHKRAVRRALINGDRVTPEALAMYPDLQPAPKDFARPSDQAQNDTTPAAPTGDPYDNLETRAGTVEKQRDAGRGAVAALAARIDAFAARSGRGSASLLGSGFLQSFATAGGTSLVGKKVEHAADLAAIAQVLRDPRFETLRIFFTRGDEIVGQTAYSSRLPAAVFLPNDLSEQIRKDKAGFGADGYFLLHNHPSGKSEPSQQDINLTKDTADAVPGFRAHVVIDRNEYAVISAKGSARVVDAPELASVDFHTNPELEHEMLGVQIQGPKTLATIGKALQIEDGHASVIFTRRQGQVQLIMDLPAALLEDKSKLGVARLMAAVRRMARAAGAGGHRFVVLPPSGEVGKLKHLLTRGIFTDVVDGDGFSLQSLGVHPGRDFLDKHKEARRVVEERRDEIADTRTAPSPLIGTPARTIDELAALAADLPTGTALVVTDGHRIRSVTDVPAALLTDRSKFSRARLRMLARRASREPGQTYLLAPEGTNTKPLRWLVQLEGLRDVVTADATSAAAAIERANRVAEAAPRYSDESPPQRRSIADWARGTLAANRPWMLGALTRDQIVDIWGRDLPQIIDFDRTVQAMDTDRASIAQAADEIVERWRKLPSKQADALADIMHSATLAGFDPDTMNATQPEHGQILADWNALSDEAHAVYRETRDTHRATLLAIRNGLADRAERTGSMGRQIADRIRLDFDRFLSHGVYFPLSRFGDLLLIADRDGERTVEAFESGAQREARARQLRADGWRVKMSSKAQYSAMRDGAAGAFTQEVMQHLEGLDIDPAQKSQLFDTLNQLAISMLPDASYRRHFKHRKGTPGFSRDAMRGFAQAQQHAAHHIARIRHADRLVAALDDLQTEIQETAEGDVTEWQHVANELTRRLEQILNPNTHPVAAAAGQVGFVMSLGGSIASGLVNLSQTPLVFFPWAGSRFGFDKAAAALTAATRDYLGGKWDRWSGFVLSDNPNIAPEERDALKRLEESGIINLTLAHDLAGAANADSTVSRRAFALNRAMKVISWTFHLPETYNRQVSALTAYRLARAAGQTHEEAIETARDGIVRSHFDYSASNRARYMHGNFIRVVSMFKQYSQQMTYMLWRNAYLALKGESAEVKSEARRMLFGVMSMHFAAAGSLGLPLGVFGVSPLLSLLAMGTGDEDDPPLDWQDEYRLWLADTFGREAGEAIAKGPLRLLLDVDLASRVGLGDLWVRAPLKEKEGRDAVEQWMLTLLGPIAGYAGQMGTAMQAFEEGQFARGVESMTPKFISSAIKAVRYETEGVRSWRGDDLGVTLSNADIIGTAMGFQPTALSEMYAGRSVVKTREGELQRRREDLMRAWREARDAGDSAGLADAVASIRRFNDKNRPFAIGPQHLKASWMAHRRAQLQTVQGINLSRRRDELREFGRFANID